MSCITWRQKKKPRLLASVQEKIAELELYQSRIKYATSSPSSFLPRSLFQKFPELDASTYKAVIDWEPLVLEKHTLEESVNHTIVQLKELLIHGIVVNQNNDWIFISQMEVYYKDRNVDAVAITSKNDTYPDDLSIKMEKQTNQSGGSWYELLIRFLKFEVVVTGGFSHNGSDHSKLVPFLGVGAPDSLARNEHYVLFSTAEAAKTTPCIRMLRDYQRKQSLERWCFKSLFFVDKQFHTPSPLEMHHDSDGYVFLASKVVYLAATKKISMEEVVSLRSKLAKSKFCFHIKLEQLSRKTDLTAVLMSCCCGI